MPDFRVELAGSQSHFGVSLLVLAPDASSESRSVQAVAAFDQGAGKSVAEFVGQDEDAATVKLSSTAAELDESCVIVRVSPWTRPTHQRKRTTDLVELDEENKAGAPEFGKGKCKKDKDKDFLDGDKSPKAVSETSQQAECRLSFPTANGAAAAFRGTLWRAGEQTGNISGHLKCENRGADFAIEQMWCGVQTEDGILFGPPLVKTVRSHVATMSAQVLLDWRHGG